MNNMTKVLVLIKSLGDRASSVLAHLPNDLSQKISVQLSEQSASLPSLTPELTQEVLAKTDALKSAQRQFSPARAEKPQADPMKQLSLKLVDERPQTIAFYVSHLEAADQARVLQYLPFTLQEAVKKCEVVPIPISKQVFEALNV